MAGHGRGLSRSRSSSGEGNPPRPGARVASVETPNLPRRDSEIGNADGAPSPRRMPAQGGGGSPLRNVRQGGSGVPNLSPQSCEEGRFPESPLRLRKASEQFHRRFKTARPSPTNNAGEVSGRRALAAEIRIPVKLLERERYLADLGKWLAEAGERSGCVALVGGEAGIGKTTLLEELARQHPGSRVLWGACDALFTPRPLAPLHDIASQARGALLATLGSGASRVEIFTAALEELRRESGTLVVLEDMHWADEASLDLLKFLGRRIQRTHALLAVTYREAEMSAYHPLRFVLGDLPRASTRSMTLAPLTECAVEQLATCAGRAAKGLYAITGGNPFFVAEALAAGSGSVPATVRDAVLARMARVDSMTREFAELVCIVPGKTDRWLLEQLLGTVELDFDGCLGIGMVRDEDGALAFRHELARRALEDSLPPAGRQALHARVLSALAARPGIAAARLVHHADGARDGAQVLRYAPIAADEATQVGAHREAAAHYEVALRYAADLSPQERAILQERAAHEWALTGEYQRATDQRRAALSVWRASGDRVREGDTLRWLSSLSWFCGDLAAASRHSIDAVATLEAVPPGPELAMAYCNRADLDMEAHEANSAIGWARRAIELAESCGSEAIMIHALNTLGTVRLISGDASGWSDLERTLELALAGRHQTEVARAYMNLGAMAVSRRDYLQASGYLGAGLAFCGEHGLDSVGLYLLAYRGRMRFEQGDWDGASDDVGAVLRHPRTTPITSIPALRTLGHIKVRRGDGDANAPLDRARLLSDAQPQLQRVGTLAAIRAEAAWLAGDREGVIRAARPAYDLVRDRRDPRMKGELAAWLARACALDESPADIAEPYAREIAGDWRGAASAWRTLGCPYEHACVLGWYAGDEEQREALALLERIGARPAAQAVRRLMRARGVRGVPRGSRPSTRSNPFGLTRRESEILALLSEGLRNAAIAKRLFVSPKTVDHHVSAILAKLAVPSRVQAVLFARRQAVQSAAAMGG